MVSDATTGQPVAGASVDVLDNDGNLVETLTADGSGVCTTSDLPAGDFALSASAPGYASPDAQPVSVPSANSISFQLSPDEPRDST